MLSRTPETSINETSRLEVVLSSTVSDSHTYNLCFLQLLLEEHACEVFNLGACVPPDLLAERCNRRPPELVVLSSVNGHGYYDGQLAVERLRRLPSLRRTPIVIGGKLGIGGVDEVRSAGLRHAGFDEVYDDSAEDLARFETLLERLRANSAHRSELTAEATA